LAGAYGTVKGDRFGRNSPVVTSEFRYQGSGDTEAGEQINLSLDAAEALTEDGRWREAIDALNGINRIRRDSEVERRLVRVRHDAFEHLELSSPSSWPPSVSGQVPLGSPPEVSRVELSPDVVTSSILGAGSLLVRKLIPAATVNQLVEGIDRALAAYDAADNGCLSAEDSRWFEEFRPAPHQQKWTPSIARKWLRSSGGVFAADSPPVLFDLLEAVNEAGITALVAAHLGEQPALSVKKTTLRRVTVDGSDASWHQDGAFMGTNIRSVNLWLPLSHCGDDAPGLDILPRRLDHVVETGTEGAFFDWAASPAKVKEAGEGVEVCRPIFEAGDALLFDHLFMHRTAADSWMSKDRHGVEMWFFAPSLYPSREIPLLV
jgi:hypothetical protein